MMNKHKKGKRTISERRRNGLIQMSLARRDFRIAPLTQHLKGHPVTGEKSKESKFVWVNGPHPNVDEVKTFFVAVDNMLAELGSKEENFPYVANVGVWKLEPEGKIIQVLVSPGPHHGTNGRPGIYLFLGMFSGIFDESWPMAFLLAEVLAETWGRGVNIWDTATTPEAVQSLDLYNYNESVGGIKP